MQKANDNLVWMIQNAITRRDAVGGNFANFAGLHKAPNMPDNDIDVDGTMIALYVFSYEFCDRSIWPRLKESPIAQHEESSHKGFFFLKRGRRGREDRGGGKGECILSCKSKGTIRYIAKRLCSLRRVSLTVDALYVPCSANVYVTAVSSNVRLQHCPTIVR